jgi:predicted  nucleic acid-binding Zn-ribbon protein
MSEETEKIIVEETAQPESENRDKALAQLEAYKRCFVALQGELEQIEQQFGADETPTVDPLKELTGEVSGFKAEMAELRKMLEDLRNAPQNNAAPQPQQYAPQPQYYMPQQPMVTPTPLPYLQTPTFAPLMPSLPNFNR